MKTKKTLKHHYEITFAGTIFDIKLDAPCLGIERSAKAFNIAVSTRH